jgi:hypothetical protein
VSKRNLVPQCLTPIPADILSVFGNPPLLSTEDPQIYWGLLSRVAQDIGPKHAIEWIWVKDIVDLSWEIRRLRPFKALLIEQIRSERISKIQYDWGYVKIPSSIFPEQEEYKWSQEEYERQLKKRKSPKLNTERDSAMAFLGTIESYEKVDKLLASAELRRNILLREIQFYREGLAHLLQEASNKIIEAECKETAEAAE